MASQRHRLLQAIAECAGTKGIVELTIADVCTAAGVGRPAFYELFKDKSDCYLTAYRFNAAFLMAGCREAMLAAGDPLERLFDAFRAYLATLGANVTYARAFLIEPLRAGPEVLDERDRIHAELTEIVRDAYERARTEHHELAEQPGYVFVGLVGAINELIYGELRRGEDADIESLAPAILRLVASILETPRNAHAPMLIADRA